MHFPRWTVFTCYFIEVELLDRLWVDLYLRKSLVFWRRRLSTIRLTI